MGQKEYLIKLNKYLNNLLMYYNNEIQIINTKNNELELNINKQKEIISILTNLLTNLTITDEETSILLEFISINSELEINQKDINILKKWGNIQQNSPQIKRIVNNLKSKINLIEENIKTLENEKELSRQDSIIEDIQKINIILNSFNDKNIIHTLKPEEREYLFELLLSSDIIAIYSIDIIREFLAHEEKILKEKITESKKRLNESQNIIEIDSRADEIGETLNTKDSTEETVIQELSEEDKEKIEQLYNELHSYYKYYQLTNEPVKIDGSKKTFTSNPFYGQEDKETEFIDYIINSGLVTDNEENRIILKRQFYLSLIHQLYELYIETYSNKEKLLASISKYGAAHVIEDLTYIHDPLKSIIELIDIKVKKPAEENIRVEELIPAKNKGLFIFLTDKEGNLLFEDFYSKLRQPNIDYTTMALTQLRNIGPEIEFHNIGAIKPITANSDNSDRKNTNKSSVIKLLEKNNIKENNHFRYRQSDIRLCFIELKPTGERKKQIELELGRKIGKVCLITDVWPKADINGTYKEHNAFIAKNITIINYIRNLFNGSGLLNQEQLEQVKSLIKYDKIYEDEKERRKVLGGE